MSNLDRKWNPTTDVWPEETITFPELKHRLDNRPNRRGDPAKIYHKSPFVGTEDDPAVYWMENWAGCSSNVSINQVQGTEKLCREEAKALGFMCVVIRSGVRSKTNLDKEDGTILTEFNVKTGHYQNVVADDDPHITVYMGHSLDELAVQGHIYIVWDRKAIFDMRLVKDPLTERKIAVGNRGKVASEYWYISC
ncbi:hypothetical protein N0V85_007668 [Neurospora sp. IMI 360204]|nr:hypothetical protein N0V85_007668 [Neurospora sp. IMI 360204]